MKSLKLALLLGSALIALSPSAFAQTKGGVINVATIGEPPTLDAMASTADLVGIVSQHIFETLYTFDKSWNVTPLLAASLPEVSADGKVYTIKLRTGVKFHDGTDMDSADVVASLKRWTKIASRGKQTASMIASIEAVDPATVKITLNAALCPAGFAAGFQQCRRDHPPERKAAKPDDRSGRYRALHAEGAQGRPVYPAGTFRRLQIAPKATKTAMAVPAINISMKSALFLFRTPIPVSKALFRASSTTSTACRSKPMTG